MVVLVLQDAELKVRGVGDVDLIIKEEESFGVDGPTWRQGVKLGGCDWIGAERQVDVRAELLNVHDDHSAQGGNREECCAEG